MAYNNIQSCVYLFFALACSSHAFQFNVGGRDGWVVNPKESYNHWAERLRFQVNDTLWFKYNKGSDSVLVVNKEDYEKCETQNPILKLEDGNSIFKFDRSGPFFFISGNKSNCDHGQKLIIVVLAVRNRPSPPGTNGTSPARSPPTWPSPSPAPAYPKGEAPSPGVSPSSPYPPGVAPPTPAGGNGGGNPPPHRSFATPAASAPSLFVLVSTVSLVLSGFIVSI